MPRKLRPTPRPAALQVPRARARETGPRPVGFCPWPAQVACSPPPAPRRPPPTAPPRPPPHLAFVPPETQPVSRNSAVQRPLPCAAPARRLRQNSASGSPFPVFLDALSNAERRDLANQ